MKRTTFANLARVVVAELAGSLEGVRVLELGHIIGGPFCGHLLTPS
jgi:crotonobetainyl-CoA:carnitine CoA-transferase CaiB-like acyl-CoA transferase